MSNKVARAAVFGLLTAILLVAPVWFVELVAARQSLAVAAREYDANTSCTGPAARGLPLPTRPIPDAARTSVPCAITGAMVTEKDTTSQGLSGAPHYALGLRSDAGVESIAKLEDYDAPKLWNAVQTGDRVLIQTLHGGVALVGDGTRTVRTVANPRSAARDNATGIWIAGALCVLELTVVGFFLALGRRGASGL